MKYLSILSIAIFLFASCTEEQKVQSTAANLTPAKQEVTLDPQVFNQKLDQGISISEARKLKAGDEVLISGKIIGAHSVFVENRASFIIGDHNILTSCDLHEGDNCQAPWDVCCEESKDIAANTLSIQLVDDSGMILKTGLKGKNGLKELSLVTIKGSVSPQSSEAAMIINATAIQLD
ncbi:hypothetical protein PQO03_17150 [Lentisphaera profundi]|uniref:DUF5666 domain-containing protein n=1 Tax=Lentisphaera profundi TaxID=1658616 RepID=A0ABY7VXP0_9BACT|nr:hypothetical protein [Lentisphaera profundi]WDE97556.1 hypothetical protein PQO03_17150 [Lentisphaera profundi]